MPRLATTLVTSSKGIGATSRITERPAVAQMPADAGYCPQQQMENPFTYNELGSDLTLKAYKEYIDSQAVIEQLKTTGYKEIIRQNIEKKKAEEAAAAKADADAKAAAAAAAAAKAAAELDEEGLEGTQDEEGQETSEAKPEDA